MQHCTFTELGFPAAYLLQMNFAGINDVQMRVDICHYLHTLCPEHPDGRAIMAATETTPLPTLKEFGAALGLAGRAASPPAA